MKTGNKIHVDQMKWESQEESENTRITNEIGSQEESENTRITNKIVRQEDSEITRLNHKKCRKVRNPRNSGRAIIMEGESAQGDARVADAGVSVARITDTGFTDAGIADAGFASHRCHNARSAFKSGCEENADASINSASRQNE